MIDFWVSEHDLCEECGELLDYFGLCPNGCESEIFEEGEEYGIGAEEEEDPYFW